MKERLLALRPLLLRVVGYPLFFGFFFLTFLYYTFPYDRLRETIIAAVEAPRTSATGRVTQSNMELSIGSLSPTFLPGLEARDVTVTSLPTRPGDHPTTMHLDKVRVRVSLFALLVQTASVHFAIEGMGGEIVGDVSASIGKTNPGLRDLKVTLTDVRVGELAPLVAMVGLPIGGRLSGEVELAVPDGAVNQSEGQVRLTVAALTVGNGQAQYQIPHFGGVTVEQIRAGDLAFNVNIRRGAAVLDRVGAHSAEFDLQMDGRIDMRPNFGESPMNLGVRFRLTDVYRNKSEQAGRILSVMDMAPDLRRARRPDGLLAFRCTGTVERNTTCQPDTRGATPAAGTPMPPGFAP